MSIIGWIFMATATDANIGRMICVVAVFDVNSVKKVMKKHIIIIIRMGCNMFIIAVKVGAPVMVALLLTSAALGLIARTVPQMQIFIVAMPLKIIVGLLFLAFSFPILSWFFKQLFNGLGNDILTLLKAV